jgi:3-oxoacyl-[acyl-carrier protein] reductase
MNLKNKVAIITGGKRGIGKAIAFQLAAKGVNLAICSKSREGLEMLEQELNTVKTDIKVICHAVDICKNSDVELFIQSIYENFGQIDILINNAAVIRPGMLHETTEKTWYEVMDTNLKGPFLVMKNVIPIMKKQRSGHILNICSVLAKEGFANFSLHCAAKFGLRGLSLSVREELKKDNIIVSIVNPGTVSTDMWMDIDGEHDHSKMVKPEEIANAVLFALSNSDKCVIDELDVTPKNDIALR